MRSEEHTSELQSLTNLVCRLLLEKKKKKTQKLGLVATHGVSYLYTLHHAVARAPQIFVLTATVELSLAHISFYFFFFFFNDTAPTEIYPLSLHDALPI